MKKIAVLVENLFNEKELIYPYYRLLEDYDVDLVGSEKETAYKSENGVSIESDLAASDINPDDYDGVFIPGGYSPDYMRRNKATVDFVRALFEKGKPVGAICHAGWMLAEACDIRGKKLTSVASIRTDMENAGANWVDEEVVVDGNIITGRGPKDLPAVIKAFVAELEKN
ncbi:MAG: type 1 glutamine amidotransferase domain-containing protein [Finegoldia sp.]|nr:type 1 glutamine amidotransferase domain-containing protein [Finegoldia sp.]